MLHRNVRRLHTGRKPLGDQDLPPVRRVRRVAARVRKPLQEWLAYVYCTDAAGQLDGPGGVAKDLTCLDTGEVVEEPTAARKRQHRVPLHLEETQRPAPVHFVHRAAPRGQELGSRLLASENHVDVRVACGPWISEETGAFPLE